MTGLPEQSKDALRRARRVRMIRDRSLGPFAGIRSQAELDADADRLGVWPSVAITAFLATALIAFVFPPIFRT